MSWFPAMTLAYLDLLGPQIWLEPAQNQNYHKIPQNIKKTSQNTINFHKISNIRHQVASRSYRTMLWWRFVPSLDLEMLGNQTQYEEKKSWNLKLFFYIWSWSPCAILLQKSQHHTITLTCLESMLGLGILQLGSPLLYNTCKTCYLHGHQNINSVAKWGNK